MSDKEKDQLSLDLEASIEKAPGEEKEPSDSGKSLEWICHPAKKNMRTTVLVTIFLFVVIGAVYYATGSVWFGILAVVILFGSLASFYFPTRYRLTEDGIFVKTTAQNLQKKWSQYRSYYMDKNGVLLSPFVRPSRLENFRGVYLKFWYNKEEVMAFVKEQMEKSKSEGGE
ncbi:MAG TPA: hypothetical protein ENH25_08560 [candidate division Zixibacteria bacterium]|nr:hypothetical protein [candidate division Zixibacteria bacterium]